MNWRRFTAMKNIEISKAAQPQLQPCTSMTSGRTRVLAIRALYVGRADGATSIVLENYQCFYIGQLDWWRGGLKMLPGEDIFAKQVGCFGSVNSNRWSSFLATSLLPKHPQRNVSHTNTHAHTHGGRKRKKKNWKIENWKLKVLPSNNKDFYLLLCIYCGAAYG